VLTLISLRIDGVPPLQGEELGYNGEDHKEGKGAEKRPFFFIRLAEGGLNEGGGGSKKKCLLVGRKKKGEWQTSENYPRMESVGGPAWWKMERGVS